MRGERSTLSWLAGGLAAVLSLPLISYHFAYDQGIYAAIGDSLLKGGVVYRDAWEFRPPGIFYAYFLSFLAFGRSEWAVHALEVLAVALSAAGLQRIGEYRFGSRRAGMAAALTLPLLYVPFGHWSTAQCESYQMPFLVWSLALWPKSSEEQRAGLCCLASGVLMGAAGLVKTPVITFATFLLADRVLMDWPRKVWSERLRLPLLTLGGMLALPLILAAYLVLRGAFVEFVHAVFVFGPAYAARWPENSFSWHATHIVGMFGKLPPPGILLLLIAAYRGWNDLRTETVRWGAALVAGMLSMALQRRYFGYHHLILLPWFSLGIGLAVREWPGPRMIPKLSTAVLLAASLVCSAGANLPRWIGLYKPESIDEHDEECALGNFSYRRDERLAGMIRRLTASDDRIFIWSNEPLAYFLSDRLMAGPYSHLQLVVPPWEDDSRLRALIHRLEGEKPKLVITGGDGALMRSENAQQLLELYPDMREFIHASYECVKRIEDDRVGEFQFWLRRPK